MQPSVAEAVARSTREQAVTDARADMQELRRRAVEAGRDRSRKIIKTSRIEAHSGEVRYNPAGRLLRDWYLHVYLNTLRSRLGEPAVAIDAQQVEDTTAQLHRLRIGTEGLNALRAVAGVRDVAIDDAAHAATDVVLHSRTVAARRAVLHASDERFDGDQLPIHVSRHWYQRCYDDHVYGVTGSRQPLSEVTSAEEHQVALVLESGEVRRLISSGGLPLITRHDTILTSLDQDIAAGAAGLVSPISDAKHQSDATRVLRSRVTRTWTALDDQVRAQWLRLADVSPVSADLAWGSLDPEAQTKIIRLYLDTHSPAQLGVPFGGRTLDEEPRLSATIMFNHQAPLDSFRVSDTHRHQPLTSGVPTSAVDLDSEIRRVRPSRANSAEASATNGL